MSKKKKLYIKPQLEQHNWSTSTGISLPVGTFAQPEEVSQ